MEVEPIGLEASLEIFKPRLGFDCWDCTVELNCRLARTFGWQYFRSAIVHLLGFTQSITADYAFAAGLARWQGCQELPANGILGPRTFTPIMAALQSNAKITAPPNSSIHNVSSDFENRRRRLKEFSGEAAGAEPFWTDPIGRLSDGHTSLTRLVANRIAKSFPSLKPKDVDALVEGSLPPDKVPATIREQMDECQQRCHALRDRPCQETTAALEDICAYLTKLYKNALANTNKPNFILIGEALHLIQNSYSPAHMEREHFAGPPHFGLIIYLRFWNPISPGFPLEHSLAVDIRDRLDLLSPQGIAASAATVEFSQMVCDIFALQAPGNRVAFRSSMNRHFGLSSASQSVAGIISTTRTGLLSDPRNASYQRCVTAERSKAC